MISSHKNIHFPNAIIFCYCWLLFFLRFTTYSIKIILVNKGRRLLLPYFIIGIFWMFPIKYYVGYYKDIDLFEFVWNNLLLQKDNGHLWYLPCLFFVFLCMYLIIKSYQCFASTMLKNDVRIFEGIGVFCLSGISILAPILWRGRPQMY